MCIPKNNKIEQNRTEQNRRWKGGREGGMEHLLTPFFESLVDEGPLRCDYARDLG